MRIAFHLLLIGGLVALVGCAQKKPDPAQEVRAFMANWERAVDAKNVAALDSLLTTAGNSPAIDSRRFLAEIYSSAGITEVNLLGRELDIGDKQATVKGRLVRSGISDSLSALILTLIRTNKGWKLAAYRFAPFEPVKKDTTNLERSS